MKVTSLELSKKIFEAFPEWKDTEYVYGWSWDNDIDAYCLPKAEYESMSSTVRESSITCPAYDTNFLEAKVKNYDWTIVNLNETYLSLTSDSLDDPDGAILGESLSEVFGEFALLLKEQGEKL